MEEFVTLEEMLRFREEKVRMQEELQKKHEESVIVALGMNIPGPIKYSPEILEAFKAGTKAIGTSLNSQELGVAGEIEVTKKEGCLKILSVESDDPFFIKKMMVNIEETHPLGRLYDIDVYDKEGKGISREAFGAPVRRCLLCGQEAKVCGRNRSHTVEELYKRVEDIIRTWLKEAH
jgi:holo-ACP synthase